MSALCPVATILQEESWKAEPKKRQRKVLRRSLRVATTGKTNEGKETAKKSRTKKGSIQIKVQRISKPQPAPTFKALKIVGRKTYELQHSCPEPEFLNDEEVMIRNYAAGLNPIDWKSVDFNFCLPEFPWVTGREMAGIVHKVAPGVTRLKPGDRVWTSTYYRDVRAGCFQDLVVVPEHTVLPIPANMDFESAACLGVAALTSAMTLWKWLKVPRTIPGERRTAVKSIAEKDCLLVWGGSSSTGQFAVQIAVQSGLQVIAVTSTKTQALVEKLGAQVITRDGKSNQEIVEAVRAIGGDRITRGLDLVGNDTAAFSVQCLSATRPSIFAPLAMMKAQDVPSHIEVVTVEMKHFVNDKTSKSYAEDLNLLLEHGKLRLPELEILRGGLAAIEPGLERLKKGDMGGKKLVVSWG